MKSSACKNYRSKNAFSLIELSIVILIVGILIAGVTSSSRLVKRMKVITAQNLTLKESAIGLGLVTKEQFDEWVDPKKMIWKIFSFLKPQNKKLKLVIDFFCKLNFVN